VQGTNILQLADSCSVARERDMINDVSVSMESYRHDSLGDCGFWSTDLESVTGP
jgi:hypothetical protein